MIIETDTDDMTDDFPRYITYFTAPWCIPCRQLKPEIYKLSEQTDIPILMIDVDKAPRKLLEFYEIQTIPQVLLITNNGLIGIQTLKSRTATKLLEEIDG